MYAEVLQWREVKRRLRGGEEEGEGCEGCEGAKGGERK